MRPSLGHAAYLALSRRAAKSGQSFDIERPAGEVAWLHASGRTPLNALAQLGQRLISSRPGLHVLLTTAAGVPPPTRIKRGLLWQEAPGDNLPDTTAFLLHWRPNIALWSGSQIQPASIHAAKVADIPVYLIDAGSEGLVSGRWRWVPDLTRGMLREFSGVLARSEDDAVALRQLGVAEDCAEVAGPLSESGAALTCNESDREHLTETFAGRPVWLAAMVQPEEIDMILAANRAVIRFSHRLLLIIVPDDENDGDAITARLRDEGWRTRQWSAGEWPDENTQVLVADTRGELGLWYRLSPITLVASSLAPGQVGRDPFEPAALGSAVIYGPNVGRHLDAFSRLAEVGAARIVKDAEGLATEVIRLLAPDQAAAMAHAAWDVVSAGASVTDKIVDVALDALDRRVAV